MDRPPAFARVFVTGASSGIGEALARHYARSGVVVGLVARRAAFLATLAEQLTQAGARPMVFAGDVADTAFLQSSARAFLEEASGIDLVVANAGIGIRGDSVRVGDAAAVSALMRVNVVGVTNTIVPFVPTMIAQGSGVLAALSSFAGFRALPGRAAYCASKAAVTTFMDGVRMDLEGSGAHAMSICPGFVATPMTAGYGRTRFMVPLDQAVGEMTRAIERRARTFTFPWQMRVLRHVLAHAPERVVRALAPPGR